MALSGFDDALARALGTAIAARKAAAAKIPDHLPTPYPPPDLSARELRDLAEALDILYPAN